MRQNFGKITLLSVAVSSAMILSACSNSSSGKKRQPINPITPVVNTKPTYVNIMEISSISKDDVTINWLPAQDDNTPSSQIRYELHASDKADFTLDEKNKIYSVVGKYSAVIENKLTGGKSYYVRLVATDKDGNKTISEPMSVKVSDKDPVVKPVTSVPNNPTIPKPADPNAPNISPIKNVVAVPVDKVSQTKVTATQITLPKQTEIPQNGGFIVSADVEKPYLRKVVSSEVNKATGETVVKTERASLNEVIEETSISSAFKMSALPKEVETGLQTGLIQLNKKGENSFEWQSDNYSYTAGTVDNNQNQNTAIQAGLAKIEGTNEIATDVMTISLPKEITLSPNSSQTFNISSIVHKNSNAHICKFEFKNIREVRNTSADASRLSVETVGGINAKHKSGDKILQATQSFKVSAKKGVEPLGQYDLEFEIIGDKMADGCDDWGIYSHKKFVTLRVNLVPTDVLPNNEKQKIEQTSESLFKVKGNATISFDPVIEFDKRINWGRLDYAKFVTKAKPMIEQELTIETRDAESKIDKTFDLIKPRKFHKVYMAGSVPVLITGEMTLQMHIEGKATGKLKATEKLGLGFKDVEVGFEYKNGGFHTIQKGVQNHYFTVHGTGEASAELKINVTPSIKLTAYEVASARIVAEPYLKAMAGIDGHVDYVAGKDPDGYIGKGFDADYRLTDAYISGGFDVYAGADFSVFDKQLWAWPKKGIDLNDVSKYKEYHKFTVIPDTKIMGIPHIEQPQIDFDTYHPTDSRAIMVQGIATDVLFPFTKKALISWQQWTTPRVLNTRSSNQDAVITREPSDWSKNWFTPKQAGTYTIRLGGYSSLGSWARQYKDVEIAITDKNNNGILDYWEERYNVLAQDVNSDADGDGLTLLEEFRQGKNPTQTDNPAQADLPTIVITPAQPVKGEKFTISLAGGNPDKFGSITWNYDGKQTTTSAPNVYKAVEHTSDKYSINVVLTFLDKQGKQLGTRQQVVNLSNKTNQPIKPISPNTPIPIAPIFTGKTGQLAKTNMGSCYGGEADKFTICSLLNKDWLNLGQDGEVQAGASISYTELTNGVDTCIKDNVTGLMWEQKTEDGLQDKDNTYAWYNTDPATNGGDAGEENKDGTGCTGSVCNTQDFIAKLNEKNYCGYNDWRLPTKHELESIVDYGGKQPTIHSVFLGQQSAFYWSSSPNANGNGNAWGVYFGDGTDYYGNYNKAYNNYVRAVRSD